MSSDFNYNVGFVVEEIAVLGHTKKFWCFDSGVDQLSDNNFRLCNTVFVFWLALRARQNTAQLVKILSDTTQQNV